MIKVTNKEVVKVDITEDLVAPYGDDDDNQYVYGMGDKELFEAGKTTLVIGNLHIELTHEQEEKVRYFFQNT